MATFLVDMPSRELVGIFLIADRLSKFSQSSTIFIDEQDHFFGDHGSNLIKRMRLDKGFIFTPSFNIKRTPSILLRARRKRIPLIVYHSEQFFQGYYNKEKFNTDSLEAFADAVDLHLVWGEYFRDRLMAHGIPARRIAIVGSIKNEIILRRKALASPPFPSISVAKGSDRYDYLFLSSFSIADLTDADWTTFQRQFSLARPIDERPNARVCRAGMLAFIRRIAALDPSKRLLVRRHPGEPVAPYDALRDLPNVTLSDMGEISGDILSSALIVLQDSTAAFEVEAAGRPWISVNFANSDEMYRCEPREAFPRHDADLVIEKLKSGSIVELAGSTSMAEKGLAYFIGPSDMLVSSRIAEAITGLKGPYSTSWTPAEAMRGAKMFTKAGVAFAAMHGMLGALPFMTRVRRRLAVNSALWSAAEHEFSEADLSAAAAEAAQLLSAGEEA